VGSGGAHGEESPAGAGVASAVEEAAAEREQKKLRVEKLVEQAVADFKASRCVDMVEIT
jgi:hypothetical protein